MGAYSTTFICASVSYEWWKVFDKFPLILDKVIQGLGASLLYLTEISQCLVTEVYFMCNKAAENIPLV